MSSLRYRGKKNILELTKNLDAFGKIPDEYKEPSEIGGTISLLSRILIIYLIYSEIAYYSRPKLLFTFKPDINLDIKVRMNVDITIAMPCVGLSGIDLIDDTKQDVFSYGILKRESTWWDLDANQRLYFEEMQHVNKFLREEYHSLADLLFKDIVMKEQEHSTSLHNELPSRTSKPNIPYDACRLHGTFLINKVAGILHFISGETLSFGFSNNHWHLNEFHRVRTNFSHRINKLSFGDLASRVVHVQPLEGDEKIVPDKAVMQYFIEIVPTEIHNVFSTIAAYQYSVKENVRIVDSHKNSYGLPGVYFKYDWAALKVIVKPDRENLIKFSIRLCSIIAGIIKASGILNSFIRFSQKHILRFFAPHIFNKDGTLTKMKLPIVNAKSKSEPLITTNFINNSNNYNNVTNSLLSKANLIPNETLPIFLNK
ncbi:endoplasmic reticulum-Golgi intermediate compartment protein 2 [Condylostylus longicornis]|uniref:endoplasmic reticulum-Golgi intermediate compartment protein 2 n=1 Tax=Condylostylus longicornis TaxID=2530218 RepID=UPI00244E4DD5|nr:endoplasmic reticulum-Golgi intermediate compartment protein 2 [Condylostylus longicornis]